MTIYESGVAVGRPDVASSGRLIRLPDGDVETALLDLILDIAEPGLTLVAQDLTKYPLEAIIARLPHARSVRVLDDMVLAPADVKGGAVAVATVFCRILITSTQEGDVVLATHERGDNDLGRVDSLDHLAVDKGAGYTIEEHLRSGYKVGYTVVEALEIVVGAVADVHELMVVGMRRHLAVLHRLYAQSLCRGNLYVVEVGEGAFKSRYTQDAMAPAQRLSREVAGQGVRRREQGVGHQCMGRNRVQGRLGGARDCCLLVQGPSELGMAESDNEEHGHY